MTDWDWLSLLVVIQGFTALVGPHLLPAGFWPGQIVTSVGISAPSVWDSITWIWNSASFLVSLMTFQIPGMPLPISAVFAFMALMTGYLLLKLIRGN